MGFDFLQQIIYLKKPDIENLIFLFHGLLLYLLEKRIKIGGHRASVLSGGSDLTPPHLFYVPFRNANFCCFYYFILIH